MEYATLIERLEKSADYYDPLLHNLAEYTHVGHCDLLRSAAAALRRLTADLDRYRYAVQWASADAWDAGGEMRARFEWARGEDRGAHLDNNRAAEIGQAFLKTTGRRPPHKGDMRER
jgi:hypothetical protein